MMNYYLIIEEQIQVGFFQEEKDRDEAFHKHFVENKIYDKDKLIQNPKKRWGHKSDMAVPYGK